MFRSLLHQQPIPSFSAAASSPNRGVSSLTSVVAPVDATAGGTTTAPIVTATTSLPHQQRITVDLSVGADPTAPVRPSSAAAMLTRLEATLRERMQRLTLNAEDLNLTASVSHMEVVSSPGGGAGGGAHSPSSVVRLSREVIDDVTHQLAPEMVSPTVVIASLRRQGTR
jgi:hypothetical protein